MHICSVKEEIKFIFQNVSLYLTILVKDDSFNLYTDCPMTLIPGTRRLWLLPFSCRLAKQNQALCPARASPHTIGHSFISVSSTQSR